MNTDRSLETSCLKSSHSSNFSNSQVMKTVTGIDSSPSPQLCLPLLNGFSSCRNLHLNHLCFIMMFCPQIFEPNGVTIFRIPSPIFFGNIEFFKDKLIEAVRSTHLPSPLLQFAFSENGCL